MKLIHFEECDFYEKYHGYGFMEKGCSERGKICMGDPTSYSIFCLASFVEMVHDMFLFVASLFMKLLLRIQNHEFWFAVRFATTEF